MRNATDVKITDRVYISRQLYVKNKQRNISVAKTIAEAERILSLLLNVPDNFTVRICLFKTRTTLLNGRYWDAYKLAEIAPRMDVRSMIKTLAHEMVHAEQHHEGRLTHDGSNAVWKGEVSYNKGSTYASYRAQPWEVEAFDRERELAEIIYRRLGL